MSNKFFTKVETGLRKAVLGLGNAVCKLSRIQISFPEDKPTPVKKATASKPKTTKPKSKR